MPVVALSPLSLPRNTPLSSPQPRPNYTAAHPSYVSRVATGPSSPQTPLATMSSRLPTNAAANRSNLATPPLPSEMPASTRTAVAPNRIPGDCRTSIVSRLATSPSVFPTAPVLPVAYPSASACSPPQTGHHSTPIARYSVLLPPVRPPRTTVETPRLSM